MSLTHLPVPPFAIPFHELPPDIADAFMWLNDGDDLRDLGVPDGEIPAFAEWREMRGSRG